MRMVMVKRARAMPVSMMPTPAKRMPWSQSAVWATLRAAAGSPRAASAASVASQALRPELAEEDHQAEEHQQGEDAGGHGEGRPEDLRLQGGLDRAAEDAQPAQDGGYDHGDGGEDETHAHELVAGQPGLEALEGGPGVDVRRGEAEELIDVEGVDTGDDGAGGEDEDAQHGHGAPEDGGHGCMAVMRTGGSWAMRSWTRRSNSGDPAVAATAI